jgi:pyruvate kinase
MYYTSRMVLAQLSFLSLITKTVYFCILNPPRREAEGAQDTDMLYQAVRNSTLARYGILSTSESIASSAVKTAIDVNAKVLIVCSESGTTATQVAKFRPGRPIIVLTLSDRVARQCCGVLRGCSAKVLGRV